MDVAVYAHKTLHQLYVGAELARAQSALDGGMEYLQDFPILFEINTDKFPLIYVEADSFAALHRMLVGELFARGLTAPHADVAKGMARTGAVLATLRDSNQGFSTDLIPRMYAQGTKSIKSLREAYAAQLLREDHDGSYSYGERTTTFFGFNQIAATIQGLNADPSRAWIIQRFDPSADMSVELDEKGQEQSSHDPCLTHDIYYVSNGKLHVLHIARAHNTVNAYPENVWGLHDAYDTTIATELGLPLGDFHMLSSRANILLLTEQERAKAIIAENTRPSEFRDNNSGPFKVSEWVVAQDAPELQVCETQLTTIRHTDHDFIQRLLSYNGIDTIHRAISYLEVRGTSHNNPILSTYYAPDGASPEGDLVFYQANVYGDKLHVTAVFANRQADCFEKDQELCHYIATLFADQLGVELGNLTLLRV